MYSYLSAYAGADESAFPSVDLIKHELGIGKHRFLRAKNELIDNGYLTVDRKQTKNIYGSNLYTLFHIIDRLMVDPSMTDLPMTDRSTVNPLQITVLQITVLQVTVRQLIIAQLTLRVNAEEWWKLYDKKLDKKKAFSLFKSALKNMNLKPS